MDKRTKEYREMMLTSHITKMSTLDRLKAEAVQCHYVRFHQPVPPGLNREPVSEFKINSNNKYSVDSMLYHPVAGLIFEATGSNGHEEDITPTANIIYVRV